MTRSRTLANFALIILLAGFCNQQEVHAESSLESGARAYLEENYESALRNLERALKSNPNDGKAHYYAGLCYMRMRDKDKAEEYFNWIETNSSDPQLKLLAKTWLARIDRRRKHIGDGYSIGPPHLAKEHGPVTKVFWFYAPWCPKCKRFKEIFEFATKSFPGVKFEKYNAEDLKNWDLVSKYEVRSYPTLVYFDKKGKVIENYAAAPMGDTFARHLVSLGAKQ